jgi:hypothetical protein
MSNAIILFFLLGAASLLSAAEESVDSFRCPYDKDPTHPWNHLHQALFERVQNGTPIIHRLDPIERLADDKTYYILRADRYQKVLDALTEFVEKKHDTLIKSPAKRLFLQRDLWALFDAVSWMPDDWVYKSEDEPQAVKLRRPLALLIARLALTPEEIKALPDNYAAAVKAASFPPSANVEKPELAYCPSDFFDRDEPWVRLSSYPPLTSHHTKASGVRSHFHILLKLPEGRTQTIAYLKSLEGKRQDNLPQFPAGTQVALVRRPLAIDTHGTIRETPIVETIQIRVFRHFNEIQTATPVPQDVYALHLNRAALFDGGHGLFAELPPRFPGSDGLNLIPLEKPDTPILNQRTALLSFNCLACHAQPGIHSMNSLMNRFFQKGEPYEFYPYRWGVEMDCSISTKYNSFDWGLLRGYLEGMKELTE